MYLVLIYNISYSMQENEVRMVIARTSLDWNCKDNGQGIAGTGNVSPMRRLHVKDYSVTCR